MKASCVLIIDDSEADQFIAKLTIEECDASITILQAYDGVEALEILENSDHQPDLIFLDINMPRMDGHEFLQAYNDKKIKGPSVIVMLTSSNQEQDRDKAMNYQFVKDYILKPLGEVAIRDLLTSQ